MIDGRTYILAWSFKFNDLMPKTRYSGFQVSWPPVLNIRLGTAGTGKRTHDRPGQVRLAFSQQNSSLTQSPIGLLRITMLSLDSLRHDGLVDPPRACPAADHLKRPNE